MSAAKRIYVVTAERSGDLLGAGVIRALKQRLGESASFAGLGGAAMAELGIESPFDIEQLSIFGYVDGIKAFRRVKARVADTVADILAFKPDVVVLIDSWGFTLRVAQGVRAAAPDIKLVKYVGPQVFASRPGRARTLAANFDHLLSILSFDAPYYEPHGLPVTFVGNPTLERPLSGDGKAFRARHDLGEEDEVLLLLPGSRASEIKRLFEPFARTVAQLKQDRPGLRTVMLLAGTIENMARARLAKDDRFGGVIVVGEDDKPDAFSAANMALACSGTVVTELATSGIPAIAAYRLGWITWALIRGLNLIKTRFISLVNIAADRALVPEYVQTRCTGRLMAEEVISMLDDPARRERVSVALIDITAQMRGDGEASERAADVIETILADR